MSAFWSIDYTLGEALLGESGLQVDRTMVGLQSYAAISTQDSDSRIDFFRRTVPS